MGMLSWTPRSFVSLPLPLLLLAVATRAQLPTWHSPNYACKDALSPWPRCRAADAPERQPFAFQEWAITAWAGPWGYGSGPETQPAELQAYAAANFNLAQVSVRSPHTENYTTEAAWAFIERGLSECSKLGLATILDTQGPVKRPFGGKTGGQFAHTPGQYVMRDTQMWRLDSRQVTLPEVAWIVEKLKASNTTIAAILISDDSVDVTSEKIQMIDFVNEHLPATIPFVNEIPRDADAWLTRSNTVINSPELYSMTDNTKDVIASARAQIESFDSERARAERYGQQFWPLFQDMYGPQSNWWQTPKQQQSSFSATAFQAHAAAAYGADGIDYFCWSTESGFGVYNNSHAEAGGNRPQAAGYQAAKEANGNLLVWGRELQAFRTVAAVYHSGWETSSGFAVQPGDGVVAAMDDNLMIGLKIPADLIGDIEDGGITPTAPGFVERPRRAAPREHWEALGFASAGHREIVKPPLPDAIGIVVDKRLSWQPTTPATRRITISFGPLIRAVELVTVDHNHLDRRRRAGLDFEADQVRHTRLVVRPLGQTSFVVQNISLHGGGAILLRMYAVEATRDNFIATVKSKRPWRGVARNSLEDPPSMRSLQTAQFGFCEPALCVGCFSLLVERLPPFAVDDACNSYARFPYKNSRDLPVEQTISSECPTSPTRGIDSR